MKRRKSIGSIHFKLKFRRDERRVDIRQKSRELVTNKKEASVRRGRRTDDRAKIFIRLAKQSRHRQIRYSEGNRFGRAGKIERDEHLIGLSFKIHG